MNDPLPRAHWAPGLALTADGSGKVRLSVASLGRAWSVSPRGVSDVVRWVDGHDVGRTPLVYRMLEAGVLVDDPGHGSDAMHGPTRRFHAWAGHDHYADGADPGGAVRGGVLDRFGPTDLDAMRAMGERPPGRQPLPEDLAEVVWRATHRTREYRRIVARSQRAAELLFSYGSAYDLLVLDPAMGPARGAWADLAREGFGTPLDVNPAEVFRVAGFGPGPCRGVAVVGRVDHYQLRYRHEKALVGLLVDGGRVLAEVARAMGGSDEVSVSDAPLPEVSEVLGLNALRQLVVGVASAVTARRAGPVV